MYSLCLMSSLPLYLAQSRAYWGLIFFLMYRANLDFQKVSFFLICLHLGFVQVVYDLQETYRECTVGSTIDGNIFTL